MIDFAPPQSRRHLGEPIVPMINIVFLLLIFFLMTAAIAPPDPIDVAVPEAEVEPEGLQSDILFIGPDGTLAYGAARGDAVFEALSDREPAVALTIRADAGLPGAELAALLPQLGSSGVSTFRLIVVLP